MVKIDIVMPTYCYDCPCHNGENGRCNITGDSVFDKRPFDCPLREDKSTTDIDHYLPKWVSVKERLPEKYVDVLVCLRLTKLTRVRSLGEGNVWSDAYGYTEDFDEVTHWMPLPEPPEEMKGEEK